MRTALFFAALIIKDGLNSSRKYQNDEQWFIFWIFVVFLIMDVVELSKG